MISKRFCFIIITSAALISLVLTAAFYYLYNVNYYFHVPIKYNNGYPSVNVEIDDQLFSLDVDIGSRFPLFLNKEILNNIKKIPNGNDQWEDIKGNKYVSSMFSISHIKIGNYKLNDVIAYQSEENSFDNLGQIGKFLSKDFNLFLDFPNSRIIGCKRIEKLKDQKLISNNWIKVPFQMTRAGVTLNVKTDIGLKKFSLCTRANKTIIKSDLVNGQKISNQDEKNPIFHSFIYTIGNVEFNGVDLYPINITSELNEADGFIGMDFLKEHAIYIDYSNKFLYIEPPDEYFIHLPIKYTNAKIPCTSIQIEGKIFPIKIDLGSCYFLTLDADILEKLEKTFYGECVWLDFKGNRYKSKKYTIPKVDIGNLILTDSIAIEESKDFLVNTKIKGDLSSVIGSIGWPILDKYNLFLDFKSNAVYACRTLSKLKNEGLVSDNLIRIPFVLHNGGILIEIETDIGINRFILDTGFTRTSLKANIVGNEYVYNANDSSFPTFTTSKFIIAGKDFIGGEILLLDINPEYEFDGYLGMDFLTEFPFFIDYSNRLIYVDLGKGS